jgi:hypothetical protein
MQPNDLCPSHELTHRVSIPMPDTICVTEGDASMGYTRALGGYSNSRQPIVPIKRLANSRKEIEEGI